MLAFWDARLVILSTPKTGSTSLAGALAPLAAISIERPPLLKHTTVHRYRRFVGPYLEAASKDDWQVVALIREPRDWLGSWYRYRSRPGSERSTREISFETFVRDWCKAERPPHADVGSQAKFLRPRQGRGVDRLFRYENMDGFVRHLEARLGQTLTLPKLNVSPAGDLALSAATEDLLREAAAEDFAMWHGAS